MSSFYFKKKSTNDKYETPEHVWDLVLDKIPKESVIYEPFYLNGKSGNYFKNKGFEVIHKDEDFFENYNNHTYDIIVSNPPFSIMQKVIETLEKIDKPFMLITPLSIITRKYFDIEKYEIMIPKKRINFIADGVQTKNGCLETVFVCYKFGLGKKMQKI